MNCGRAKTGRGRSCKVLAWSVDASCQPASKSARSWAAWRSWPEQRGAKSPMRGGCNDGKLGMSAADLGRASVYKVTPPSPQSAP